MQKFSLKITESANAILETAVDGSVLAFTFYVWQSGFALVLAIATSTGTAIAHRRKKMSNDVEGVGRAPLTVIVAEQYALARNALADLLSADGFQSLQADCLEVAIAHINNAKGPAVLLADLSMDGWKSIVRHARTKTDILVIAMVGEHPFSTIYALKGFDIQVCLLKPIIYHDVRWAIRQNIGGRLISFRQH